MANQSADELADDIQSRLDIYGISTSDNVLHPDDLAVDRFAPAMKTKLAAARAKGRGGWDDKASCSGEHLAQLLIEHLTKGNAGTFEDIANFAMMLHQRGDDPQLLRTASVLRDAEIKAKAVEPIFNKLKAAHGDTTHPRAKVYLCEEAYELAEEVMQLRQQAKGE